MTDHLETGFRERGKAWPGRELLKENRIYVAWQTSDNLPYIIDHVGDDQLVLGTDYGHNDTSSELTDKDDLTNTVGIQKGELSLQDRAKDRNEPIILLFQ